MITRNANKEIMKKKKIRQIKKKIEADIMPFFRSDRISSWTKLIGKASDNNIGEFILQLDDEQFERVLTWTSIS